VRNATAQLTAHEEEEEKPATVKPDPESTGTLSLRDSHFLCADGPEGNEQ